MDYEAFLREKVPTVARQGIDVDPDEISSILKPHQRDIVRWALGLGRAAIFAQFGLGKTLIQLEIMRLLHDRMGGEQLIVLPLGVRQEFSRDARMLGLDPKFIRRPEERDAEHWLYLTNYESIRDGRLDPRIFKALSLDEAAVLRGFGGTKTFRALMGLFEGSGIYRFVATATPSPNAFVELLAYAAFLDIMDVAQSKTRFFKRNSEKADELTLYEHKAKEFWLWVATWALFLEKPSDIGHSDEGYALPAIEVHWHEVPSDHSAAGADRDGQGRMFRNAAIGVSQAASEKRDSLDVRIVKLREIIHASPRPGGRSDAGSSISTEQWVIWCDLNDEQRAIERMLLSSGYSFASLYGNQDIDSRENMLFDWLERRKDVFLSKPIMYGAGVNLQQSHKMVFVGVGFKFHSFIQAMHRIYRFLQERPCEVHIIYSEAEREIRRALELKWARHNEQRARMSDILQEYGLTSEALRRGLARAFDIQRGEASGEKWRAVNNDCTVETAAMAANSVDLIVTSIPFSTQYEYTPNYRDFGHTDDNDHFWRQMDYLSPELLRVLQPGRIMAIHCKDRITPGGLTGLGFQTLQPFHAEAIFHYRRHGFAFLGMKTVTTDVVRENNQTYRLGWSEQCKDGSRMGVGVAEYVLLFRKPPTDCSNGYADLPIVKVKPLCDDHGEAAPFDSRRNWKKPIPGTGYSRARWQLDAHGYARSSGNRLLTTEDLAIMPHDELYKWWRAWCAEDGRIYDFADHQLVSEDLDALQRLPATFMLFPPHSVHPDVWTDVARMRTMNMLQERAGREMHLCPMQFDIADRLIVQFSMPGETVFDPFMGIGTVPYCALKLGRAGLGVELSADYWADAVGYLRAVEAEMAVPTLFDLLDAAE